MRYSLVEGNAADFSTPCLVTSLKEATKVARVVGQSAVLSNATQDFKDRLGQVLSVNLTSKIHRLLIVGGCDDALTPDQFRKAATSFAPVLATLPIKSAIISLDRVRVKGKQANFRQSSVMRAVSNATYSYSKHKSVKVAPPSLATVKLNVVSKSNLTTATRFGNALDQGLQLAKDLGNEPPNVCDPSYLLKESRKFARNEKVKVAALSEKRMAELGMGAFLAVSQGSDKPGQMIVVQYQGGKKNDAPYALVGKGITFDTGGISLKPPPAMDEMKYDMCGAAAVLGVTKAVIEAKLAINLLTIVAAAENMPSGGATRPGDIVTSASGKTIEILNTDAEGRLVLCDALTHAQTHKPKVIIDVATLTGACIVALGSHASALYANDDRLAQSLLSAGDHTGDKAWRMPLWDEYQNALKSNFADVANIGGRDAGSVTAACFLSRFIEDTPWAHMDVAGSAFQGGPRKGSTGRPVPLLFEYLCQQSVG